MYLKRKKGEKTIKKIKKKVWDLNPHPCALQQNTLITTLSWHSCKIRNENRINSTLALNMIKQENH